VSLFDALCNRTLNFVKKCLYSDNILVNFVSRHAAYYSQMFSIVGRNVQYYCEHSGRRLHGVINSSKKQTVLADDIVNRTGMIQELVMDRDGLLCLSGDYFAPADVDALIAQLCDFIFLHLYYFFMNLFCVLCVRSSC